MSQFRGARSSFRTYWSAYGGWKALFSSPYLYVALLLAGAMAPTWLAATWWDTVLSVMPNVLGFSLGGFAIFLALGDDGFRRLIAGTDPADESGEASPFLTVSATFLHFIVVQLLAILVSLLARAWYAIKLDADSSLIWLNHLVRPAWWFVGFALFIYALCAAAAAGMAVFRLAGFFDDYIARIPDPSEDKGKKCCACADRTSPAPPTGRDTDHI